MIYIRMREKVECDTDTTLTVGELADVICDAELQIKDLKVPMPATEGVYMTDALRIVHAVKLAYPREDVALLGASSGMLIRRRHRRVSLTGLRAAAAFILLLAGSALAIMWFHADVNMIDAQKELYTRITGQGEPGVWLMAVPYTLGVGLGVALSFALLGRRRVSPLDVKLSEYRDALLSVRAQEGGAHGDSH